jgi:hypothetical protein
MIVHIRLREELQRRGISAYRLVQAVQGRITPKAIYALASGKAKRMAPAVRMIRRVSPLLHSADTLRESTLRGLKIEEFARLLPAF